MQGIAYDFDAKGANWNHEPSRDEVFQQVALPIYTTDADGWLTFYNESAAALWGHRPVLGKARWCGAWRHLDDAGAILPHEHCAMARAIREGRSLRDLRALIERPDGSRVRFVPHPSLLRDAEGMVMAGSNIMFEIDALSITNWPPRI